MRDDQKVVPYEDDVDIDGRPKTRTGIHGAPSSPENPSAGTPEEPADGLPAEDGTVPTPSTASELDDAPGKPSETLTESWPRPR